MLLIRIFDFLQLQDGTAEGAGEDGGFRKIDLGGHGFGDGIERAGGAGDRGGEFEAVDAEGGGIAGVGECGCVLGDLDADADGLGQG